VRESSFDKVRRVGIVVCMVSLFLPVLTTTIHWYANSSSPEQTEKITIFLFSEAFRSPTPIGTGAFVFVAGIAISIFFRKARVLAAIGYFGIALSLWQYETTLNSQMGNVYSNSEVFFEYGFLILTLGTALVLSKDAAKALFAFSHGKDLLIVNDTD
jgi:hypothetical protein